MGSEMCIRDSPSNINANQRTSDKIKKSGSTTALRTSMNIHESVAFLAQKYDSLRGFGNIDYFRGSGGVLAASKSRLIMAATKMKAIPSQKPRRKMSAMRALNAVEKMKNAIPSHLGSCCLHPPAHSTGIRLGMFRLGTLLGMFRPWPWVGMVQPWTGLGMFRPCILSGLF